MFVEMESMSLSDSESISDIAENNSSIAEEEMSEESDGRNEINSPIPQPFGSSFLSRFRVARGLTLRDGERISLLLLSLLVLPSLLALVVVSCVYAFREYSDKPALLRLIGLFGTQTLVCTCGFLGIWLKNSTLMLALQIGAAIFSLLTLVLFVYYAVGFFSDECVVKDACLWPIFVIATVRTYAGVPAWATASVLAGFIRPQYTENIPLNRLLSSIDNNNNEPLLVE